MMKRNLVRAAFMTSVLFAATVVLPACKRDDPQAAAQAAAAQHAEKERLAELAAKQFDDAVTAQDWRMARSYGEILQVEHPTSAAAARIQPKLEEIKVNAEADQQKQRLASLWSYGDEPVKKGGRQLSAAIYAQEPLDTDGTGTHPVRLIFRDHPDWGRSAYLVLQAGDFDCYKGCRLKVTVDGKTRTLPGSRPNTDEAIAMFIDDEKSLWKLVKSAKQLSIQFPTKAVGKRTADFEVSGLAPEKLPKWN